MRKVSGKLIWLDFPSLISTSAALCLMQSSWHLHSELNSTGRHYSSCRASGFLCRPYLNAQSAIAIKWPLPRL